jgi:hypothetical protein
MMWQLQALYRIHKLLCLVRSTMRLMYVVVIIFVRLTYEVN